MTQPSTGWQTLLVFLAIFSFSLGESGKSWQCSKKLFWKISPFSFLAVATLTTSAKQSVTNPRNYSRKYSLMTFIAYVRLARSLGHSLCLVCSPGHGHSCFSLRSCWQNEPFTASSMDASHFPSLLSRQRQCIQHNTLRWKLAGSVQKMWYSMSLKKGLSMPNWREMFSRVARGCVQILLR